MLVVLGSALWGTDALFRRPLTEALSPVTIVFLEHCILSAVMLPHLVKSRSELAKLGRRGFSSLLFIAIGGSVAATSLFTYSIKHGNPSVTLLLQKSQPLFTISLARALLKERPRPWFWICLLPALGGAYLLTNPEWQAGFFAHPPAAAGIAAALGAACLWGSCTVFGRYLAGRTPVMFLTGARFVIALPVLLLLYALQGEPGRLLPDSLPAMSALAGMALIPGLAALAAYYQGLRSTPASIASIGELAFPVTAVLANWLLLDIRLSGTQITGAVMLVASITLITWFSAREADKVRRMPAKQDE